MLIIKGGGYMKYISNEKGNFTIFSVFIILGIVVLTSLFLNLGMTFLNINFSKKALDEAVRSRAMAVDVPLKEELGVVEVIHTPHTGSNGLYSASQRPTVDFLGNYIPCNGVAICGGHVSLEYSSAVNYAETFAKNTMIDSVNNYIGNDAKNQEPLIKLTPKNICFDIEPLPKDEDYVEFACPLKTNSGKVYTITKKVKVKGYNSPDLINSFNDNTLTGNNTKVRVNNVVFGAAVIEPKSQYKSYLYNLGYSPEKTETFLYSVAYPQIDKCYGDFC